MLDARVVSNKFVEIAEKNGKTFTPMQILKLVHFKVHCTQIAPKPFQIKK